MVMRIKMLIFFMSIMLLLSGCYQPDQALSSSLATESISTNDSTDSSKVDISSTVNRKVSTASDIIGEPDKIQIVVNKNETVIEKGTPEYVEVIDLLKSRFPEQLTEQQENITWEDENGFNRDMIAEKYDYILLSYDENQAVDISDVSKKDTADSQIVFDQMLFSNSYLFGVYAEEYGVIVYGHLDQDRALMAKLFEYNQLTESYYQQLHDKYVVEADFGISDRDIEEKYIFDDRLIVLEDSIDNKFEQMVYDLYYYESCADFESREKLLGEHRAFKQTNSASEKQFNKGIYMSEHIIHKLTTLSLQDIKKLDRYVQEDIVSKIEEYSFEKYAIVQADVSWKHNELSLSLHPQVPDGRYFRYYIVASTESDTEFKIYDVYWEMNNDLEKRDASTAVLSCEPAFWYGQTRIPIFYENQGDEPLKIRRAYKLERFENGVWQDCAWRNDEEHNLDRPDVEEPVEPGEKRKFKAYIGWITSNADNWYMPIGRYRLTIELSDGSYESVEFELQNDIPEHNTGVKAVMEQEYYPVGQQEIKLLITNDSDETVYVEHGYILEQKKDGRWMTAENNGHVPSIDAIALIIEPGMTEPFTFSPVNDDYTFSAGKYRVIRQIGDMYYAAEFEVRENDAPVRTIVSELTSQSLPYPMAEIPSMTDLEENASHIVAGRLIDSPETKSQHVENIDSIYGYSLSQFEVDKVFKGELKSGDRIELLEPYYISDKTIIHVGNYYPSDIGRDYILFLIEQQIEVYGKLSDIYWSYGYEYGRFAIVEDETIDYLNSSDMNLAEGNHDAYKAVYADVIEKYNQDNKTTLLGESDLLFPGNGLPDAENVFLKIDASQIYISELESNSPVRISGVMVNNSSYPVMYAPGYRLEYFDGERWAEYPLSDVRQNWETGGHNILSGEQEEIYFLLQNELYRNDIIPGKYRFVKDTVAFKGDTDEVIANITMYAEFEIVAEAS